MAIGQARHAAQREHGSARFEHVDRRERDVEAVVLQRERRGHACRADRSRLHGLAEPMQRLESTRGDHVLGGLGAGHQDPIHGAPIRAEHRPEHESEEDFFIRKPARPEHLEVVGSHGPAGGTDGVDHVLDRRPGLRPDLANRPAHIVRMVGRTEQRAVRIVVDQGAVRSPQEHHREPRSQADADRGLQMIGPQLGRPEIGLRPIETAHQLGELAIAREQPLHVTTTTTRHVPPPSAVCSVSRILRRPQRHSVFSSRTS